MDTEQIHDIIRQARSTYYNLDTLCYQYMCNCVSELADDHTISYSQSIEVIAYIGSLLSCHSLAGHLRSEINLCEDIKLAQLKFWNDLLGEENVQA